MNRSSRRKASAPSSRRSRSPRVRYSLTSRFTTGTSTDCALGVGISIDDFGTGYSSLAQLHRLPVTEVKVDRAFTQQLAANGSSPFVTGIVGLGRGLGLRIVAEGVETATQAEALRAMGCQRSRGYFFGRRGEASTVRDDVRAQTPPGSPVATPMRSVLTRSRAERARRRAGW